MLLCCADKMTDSKPLEEASTALTQWLCPEHCGHLIAAVIDKYIALTREELQEWQASLHHVDICTLVIPQSTFQYNSSDS